jgi:hypothetical protein
MQAVPISTIPLTPWRTTAQRAAMHPAARGCTCTTCYRSAEIRERFGLYCNRAQYEFLIIKANASNEKK